MFTHTLPPGGLSVLPVRVHVNSTAVPSRSRPGLFHLADTQTCTCEDHKNRGADCAHILAVRLHVAQVRAKANLRMRRPRQRADGERAELSRRYAEMFSEEG